MKKFNLLYWQHYSSMAKVEDLEFDDEGVELIGEGPCRAKSRKRK